jgi:hypothetical protein
MFCWKTSSNYLQGTNNISQILKKKDCRKSKITGGNANVVKSLQSMIAGLQKRSLVESVYVTVSCNSKTPMHRRDLKKNNIMNELSDVAGDAQGIQYLI